ncbi:uncharacterized protein BX663DRAFT_553837 [Cokeromyces recurvatus]|uniref:uncharacterized protein n=1 Tax=Cokeromyces recurvatus TaxID=90255 RepID=UPI00221EE724|nr:uncharacterized protein BX663DRAFT_553837 [Cokeromyces recurvatus]KAI7900862.1 hypothetical protein BX663DRAFT_553837 [Cokeromyces recurvatus]
MKKQKNREVARTINIVNSTVGVVGENSGNVIINDVNNKRKAHELEEEKDNEIEEETSVYAVNPSLRSLYPYIYQVYRGESVDIKDIKPKYCGNTLQDIIYKHCYELFTEYKSMSKLQRSYYHCNLSGIINCLHMNNNSLTNHIPKKYIDKAFSNKALNVEEVDIRNHIAYLNNAYKDDGIDGLRLAIAKRKYEMMLGRTFQDVMVDEEYMILEMFEIMLNEVAFGDCKNNTTEINYLNYWKNVLAVTFRGKGIKLRIGESTSASTKFDRMINEVEFGETSTYISGRKIDLIVETKSVNTKNMPITIELSNAEFKKMDVDDDFITIQQNKNIRTSKSILSSIFSLNSGEPVIGLDFVGLSGYLFSAQYLESAVFITREADVYLPGDTVDFDEFMDNCEEVLALIFAYKNYIVKQAGAIDQKCRLLRRRRLVASTEDSREYLPPTFYSPKR